MVFRKILLALDRSPQAPKVFEQAKGVTPPRVEPNT